MSTPLVYGRALYYPYINLRNSNWLKVAALFYEGLDRIVPHGYNEFTDTDVTQRLNEKEEFIRNQSMGEGNQQDLFELANEFIFFAKNNLIEPEKRRALGIKLNSQVDEVEPYMIYENKVAYVVRKELENLGLIKTRHQENFGLPLQFDSLTGKIYMSFLANYLASKHHLPLVTDEIQFHPFIRCAQYDLQATHESKIDYSQLLGSLVISAAVPRNIQEIPISKIMDFRQAYADERREFYIQINQLVKDIENIDNPGALKDCLEFKKKQVNLSVKNLDRAFKGMGFATATILLGLSVPQLASGLGAGYAEAGLIALGTTSLVSHGINYYNAKAASPYSYVLSLKQLIPRTLSEDLLRGSILV